MFDEYHSQLISALQQGRYIKNRTEGNVLEMRQGLSLTIPCQQSSSLIFMVHYAFMNDLAHQYSQFHYRNYQPSERISLLRNNLSKLLFFSRPSMCSVSSLENKCLCACKIFSNRLFAADDFHLFMIYYLLLCVLLQPGPKRQVLCVSTNYYTGNKRRGRG